MARLAPSILSASEEKFDEQMKLIEAGGADLIHYDVMDGVFVPATVNPIPVKELSKKSKLPIDVHLMVQEAGDVIEQYLSENTKYITVHQEACKDLKAVIDKIHGFGVKAGLAINPDTPISVLKPYFRDIDLALVMSVFPGKAGQKFIPSALIKVCELDELRRANNYAFRIEVDGGINLDNCEMTKKSGADILVAGSACFGAEDIKKRCEDFKKIIK